MTHENPPSDPPAGLVPFTSREQPSDSGLTENQRLRSLLIDMALLFDSAARIVARGVVVFADPADDTQRLAAETILIRLAEIGSRLPESFRSAYPTAPWNALRAVRNRISHDYRSVDPTLIWEVIDGRLPDFRRTLGI